MEQAVDGNTEEIFPVEYNDNSKGICTTATTKSDSFDEKNENPSAPF